MKVAIVTGASRGIGAATATLLAASGYAVAVNYLAQRDKAEAVVAGIAAGKGRAIAVQADLGREADIKKLFEIVDGELGPVTALVNNAALYASYGSGKVEEMPWELVESVFRVNVFGVFATCREAISRMKKNNGGAIVNISSEAGRFGGNRMAHYAASKAAINTFTVALAREVAEDNIRVNAVSPGVIATDAQKMVTPERLKSLQSSLPMGRMGSPAEVAETVAWLLSDAASYVSGAIIPVSGAR